MSDATAARAAAARRAASARAASARRNPDGTYGKPPEGYEIDRSSGQMVDVARRDAADEALLAERPFSSRAVEVAQGLPLAGEWLDEGVGALNPRAANNMRAMSDAMERQRPGQSIALNMAGGILSTAPLAAAGGASKAAEFVRRGGNALTRGIRAGALAAPAGAVEGASAFAGRANSGERAREAGKGALVGGGLAAALGPVASMTGEGVSSLAKRVKRLDVRTIADEFGLSMPAARTVKQALLNDDLDAAQTRLTQLGGDAMLADAGPATGALLDAAANTGGTALRVTREAVDGRANDVGKRLPGFLDSVLGRSMGVKTAAKQISTMTARARKAAYDMAYSRPINYASSKGRAIEDVLARVPSGTMRKAVQEAQDAMREAGIVNRQIMAQIADDGSVTFTQMPDVMQLDYLKRALGEVANGEVDQYGRMTGAGLRASRLARDLRDALKDAVPEYGRAVKIGGDKIQQDEALTLGKSLLFRNTTVEDVRAFMNSGVSREAKASLRQGLRESIEQTLSNVRRTITDPNTDAREAMTLVKEMSSRANKEKLGLILGDVRTDRLLNELDRSAAALELRAAVAGNSKTAIRGAIQGQVSAEAAPGVVRQTAGELGSPMEAARPVTRMIAGTDAQSISAREKAIFDEIAGALTRIRGPQADAALAAVRRALAGQPLKDAEAALIGRLVGTSMLPLSQQAAKHSLAK